jgi:hypothetical protein
VTELITGVDLVELMIRVAAGEKLPIKQSDVKLNGWAVESRVYAEDPFRNFLPSIGRLVRYRPPAEEVRGGVTVRNDTGVYEGGEISMFYDPMIAKLCSYGKTRMEAIERMRRALDEFYVRGVSHNVPFLAALMAHPRFRAGKLTTNFIAEEFKGGFTAAHLPPKDPAMLAAVAAVAALLVSAAASGGGRDDDQGGKLLRSTLAPSVPTDPVFHGKSPGGVPWVLRRGDVQISANGKLRLRVDGLVIPSLGTPDGVTSISASLFCGADANQTAAATTATVPLSSEGDARIRASVTLPSQCLAPIVLVHPNGATARWIAVTGWKR